MGLQLIVQAESAAPIKRLLDDVAARSEIFNLQGELWGVCVPLEVVEEVGESVVRRRLSTLNVFDLYEGRWQYA